MKSFLRFLISIFIIVFAGSLCAQEITIFGPEQYVRGLGSPDYYSDTFSALPGQGRLIVKNGFYDEKQRITDAVSSASVSLNGIQIFGPNDFNQTVHLLEAEVELYENNTVSIEISGKPDSRLTIEISGSTAQPIISFYAEPGDIAIGDSSVLTWTSINAQTCTIDQGIGEVFTSGSVTVSPAATTTYTLTAQNVAGTVQHGITITVSPLSLNIITPANNSVINRYDVMVQGTLNSSAGLETGINVNGIIAVIDGNQFTAGHVPLEPGDNTITATAKDIEGNTIGKTCTVTVQDVGDYITVSSFPESGVSPFETTIRVDSTFGFTDSNISDSGPGSVEYISSTGDEYNIRLTTPGVYYFTVEVTDNQAVVHTDFLAIELLDPVALDVLLQNKWSGMKTALLVSDIDTALTFHLEKFHEKYSYIYNALGSELSAHAQDMQPISAVYMRGDYAKYRIIQNHDVNGQTVSITYYVYFTKNSDGLWLIEKY